MPHSYFPSDTSRAILSSLLTRSAYDLPNEAFVFCSQAAPYKILPAVFEAWMRLLSQLPGSVLWLRPMNPTVQANLRREAKRRRVTPERLVFAPLERGAQYLGRYALADLYLDTYPFGSHTTVNDALFAGLPVVTLAGETFASRASGSQLLALALPELVTSSLTDYEALALALARDRKRLMELRRRLASNCRTQPLFDMTRYARDLEDGLVELWSRHLAELPGASRRHP